MSASSEQETSITKEALSEGEAHIWTKEKAQSELKDE